MLEDGPTPSPSGHFEAQLVHQEEHVCLARLYSSYPLKIVPILCDGNPRVVSLYQMGHGGGLVSQDVVSVTGTIRGGSIVVLKTQGTTKVFKRKTQSASQMSTQMLDCHVHDAGFLISVPDPTTCYRDSHLRQLQTIHLSRDASCLLVDSYTCGRCGEAWDASRIHSSVQIFREGRLVLLENMDLESSSMATLAQKIGPQVAVFGTIVLIGPHTHLLRQHVQSLKQRQTFRNHKSAVQCLGDPLVSVSDLPALAAGALVRFSASSVEDAFCLLAAILKPLAVELNLHPCPYADKTDPEALASRSARPGSVFEKLA